LSRITANKLFIYGGNYLTVNQITAPASAGIGLVSLKADFDVTFMGGPSSFRALEVFASGDDGTGIVFNTGVTVTEGDMTLDADVPDSGNGSVFINDGVTVSTTTGNIKIIAGDVNILGFIDAGSNAVTITNTKNDVQIGTVEPDAAMNISNIELSQIVAGNFYINTTNAINLDGAVVDAISFVYLNASAGLTFSGADSTFKFLSAVTGGDLALNAGLTASGFGLDLTADNDLGGSGTLSIAATKSVVYTGSGQVDLMGADMNIDGTIDAGSQNVTINGTSGPAVVGIGDATLNISNAELANITAREVKIYGAGDLTVNGVTTAATSGKDISVTAANNLTFSGGPSDFSQYLFAAASGGSITLAQNLTAGSFYFNNKVLIDDVRTITTITGGEFAATVDGVVDTAHSLSVTADDGTVTFTGAVGAVHELHDLSVNAGNIGFSNGVKTQGNQTYTGTTYLNGVFDLPTGHFKVIGNTQLTGDTGIFVSAGSVTMGPVNGNSDLDIHGQTGLSLGRLGNSAFGEPLFDVTLIAGDLAGSLPIGSALTPLYVNAVTLTLKASAATLDSAGFIDGIPISKADVSFNGAFSSTDANFVIAGVSPPTLPPTFSGLLVGADIVNYFFSTTASGLVTIRVTETVIDDSGFDSEINLFRDDGSLDLADFIANDDDDGEGPSGYESLLSRVLDAGNYLLRIGNYNFGNSTGTDPVIVAASNSATLVDSSDYTLSITGEFVGAITD
ncbi:MAG: beta strand repeat-containing protein, partial [Acidimicrobiales bacterium]